MNLELILVIVAVLSLFLLWLGERALRPLAELTLLAREITRRGLRKEDKSLLPDIPLSRSDEVSQLAREFHRMATALIERETTVESQQKRLQEQNRLLRSMGELNQNILNSIDSVLIVTDLLGRITKCNPGALRWLDVTEDALVGTQISQWTQLQTVLEGHQSEALLNLNFTGLDGVLRIGPAAVRGRTWGGQLMPLREETGEAHGAIWVLDDLTDEIDLQERLRKAENLAAVGRMSAQVAHEVRNPLHSIGLEAEMAAEMSAKLNHGLLTGSLKSILTSVDRLQKITENYLKLTRLSGGLKSRVNLRDVLQAVLATYSPVCQDQGVQTQIHVENGASLETWADRDLLEQVLGNLFRNSLQALEEEKARKQSLGDSQIDAPWVRCTMGNTERGDLWLRVEDNGPGVPDEIEEKLFTPFFTTRAQGTGLGLSFVKKVIEDHGGSVSLLSHGASLGRTRGACFEVRLPIKEVIHEENFASR
jgi:nitrogen fixation/metabolism regulation signal transduction histidine kinase